MKGLPILALAGILVAGATAPAFAEDPGAAGALQSSTSEISGILQRLQVTLDERPIRSESTLCRSFSQKGYGTVEQCTADAEKYILGVLASYALGYQDAAKREAVRVANAPRADITDLWPFVLREEELTQIAGPDHKSPFLAPSVRQRFKEMHDRAVAPYLTSVVERVRARIVQEYDDAGLSNEALGAANDNCAPFILQVCFGNCVKRPLDDLPSPAWAELKRTCEAKKREIPGQRCRAALKAADPDEAFSGELLALRGRQGLEAFHFGKLVCSAGMEGVQVRLRQKGWIWKTRWLEFGPIGEEETIAQAKLAPVEDANGRTVELIETLDRPAAPFDGPGAFVSCLGINSTNEELVAMKDAAVGGILAGLGAEGAGSSSIFDAFLRGAKIDKCRSDIKTFVGKR
ncbi:hypothetical protein GGR34_003299 [Microvirga flocculans]|uniref:DUF1311 domain-containing protein n=1 Tax=Microvirga flocculans TaxID=217168 RepID=A0A7W6IIA0_9HYPH|nr:hypothetical protein [Microvirga flocculans]MBB4041621.1 hypothetical protein [Microvirga flocculans]